MIDYLVINSRTPVLSGFTLGSADEYPVPGDYNGDGKTDPAVYNPLTGEVRYHFIEGKSLSRDSNKYQAGNDGYPFSGDFDGDGKDEFFCYNRENGKWKQNGKGFINGGAESDITVLADVNGDGKTDAIFFKPEQGLWVMRGKGKAVHFGQEGDIPVPADYDGDGKADIAVFRPSTNTLMIYGKGEYKFKGENLVPLAGGR